MEVAGLNGLKGMEGKWWRVAWIDANSRISERLKELGILNGEKIKIIMVLEKQGVVIIGVNGIKLGMRIEEFTAIKIESEGNNCGDT